jgi:hypothetical protein
LENYVLKILICRILNFLAEAFEGHVITEIILLIEEIVEGFAEGWVLPHSEGLPGRVGWLQR